MRLFIDTGSVAEVEELAGWGDVAWWQERFAELREAGAQWAGPAAQELSTRRPPADPEKRGKYERALAGLRALEALNTPSGAG